MEKREKIAICTMWEPHKEFYYRLKEGRNALGDRYGTFSPGTLSLLKGTGGIEEIIGIYACAGCDTRHVIEAPYHKCQPQWARVGRVLYLGHFKPNNSAYVRLRLDTTDEEDMTLVHDLPPYYAATKIREAWSNRTLLNMQWYLWFDVNEGAYSLGGSKSPYGYFQ